jgi:hypothetical protein
MRFDEFTISLLVSGPMPNSDALQDAHLAHLASLHDAGSPCSPRVPSVIRAGSSAG